MRALVALPLAAALVAGCSTHTAAVTSRHELSHVAVEQHLQALTHHSGVVCNHGHDMPLRRGDTYWCNLHRGQYRFVEVVIKNPRTGRYAIR